MFTICSFCWRPDDRVLAVERRHSQLATLTVFHAESESAVKIDRIQHPETKIQRRKFIDENFEARIPIQYPEK